MLRTIVILMSLSIILMMFREYNQHSSNQAAAERRQDGRKAAIERQKSVPFRPRDPSMRQRQR